MKHWIRLGFEPRELALTCRPKENAVSRKESSKWKEDLVEKLHEWERKCQYKSSKLRHKKHKLSKKLTQRLRDLGYLD